MKYNFTFKLKKEEIFEYYSYIFAMYPKNKNRLSWVRISIPALLLFTVLFFKIYDNIVIDAVFILLSIYWMFKLSSKLWTRVIASQVANWYKDNMSSLKMTEVKAKFADKIVINDMEIDYQQINSILPLKSVLLFYYDKDQMFVIPTRVVGDLEDLEGFSEFLKSKCDATVNI